MKSKQSVTPTEKDRRRIRTALGTVLGEASRGAWGEVGYSEVARRCGVTRQCVAGWYKRGHVPWGHVDALFRIAPDRVRPRDLAPHVYRVIAAENS